MALVDDLEEEVFHQAHWFLIFFLWLDCNELVIASTNSLELLLQCFGVLENILDFDESFLGLFMVALYFKWIKIWTIAFLEVFKVLVDAIELLDACLCFLLLGLYCGSHRDPRTPIQVLLAQRELVIQLWSALLMTAKVWTALVGIGKNYIISSFAHVFTIII